LKPAVDVTSGDLAPWAISRRKTQQNRNRGGRTAVMVRMGRLIITPHSAFYTPQAWDDIRSKSAEPMRASLLDPRSQNGIPPESD